MHKRFLNILVIVLIFSLSQLEGFSQMRIGVKGGLNLSGLYNDAVSPSFKVSKTGFHGGVVVDRAIVPKLVFLQSELLFSQKGDDDISSPVLLNYIETPFSLRLNIPVIHLYFNLGGYIGYCIDGSEKDIPIVFTKNNHRFDVGYHAGIGAFKKVKLVEFFIEARYSIGALPLKMIDAGESYFKNMNLGITAGILIGR